MSTRSSKPALIVVDMQEDFCEPNGSLAIKGARELAPIINSLLNESAFVLKIATQDWHPMDHISFASQHEGENAFESKYDMKNPENEGEMQTITLWPDHCVQGMRGASIIPELDQTKLDHIIQKGGHPQLESFSGFGPPFRKPSITMTSLQHILQKEAITDLLIVGVGFDGCVKTTAIDAVDFGYKTFIVREGVNTTARSPELRNKTLLELEEAGVEIISIHSPMLREILQAGPAF